MNKDADGRYLEVDGGKIYLSGFEYLFILGLGVIGVLCFVGIVALVITSIGA